MLLTSVRRARQNLELQDKIVNNRKLKRWITTISFRIESYLNRSLKKETGVVEYFDTLPGQLVYYPRRYPVTSITSVESDSEGLYDNPTSESDFYIGKNGDSVVLDIPVLAPVHKGLKVTFDGGVAEHAVSSVYEMENFGAVTFVAGKYVLGATSGAVGFTVDFDTPNLTIEVLYGIFEAGESLQAYDDEDLTTATTNMTGDILTKTKESLVEIIPEIVDACELEIRYMDDHKSDFENESSMKGETKRWGSHRSYNLLPEVRSLLDKHSNIIL